MTLNYNFITLFYIVLSVVSFRLTDHGERTWKFSCASFSTGWHWHGAQLNFQAFCFYTRRKGAVH